MKFSILALILFLGTNAFANPLNVTCSGHNGQAGVSKNLVFGDGTPDKKEIARFNGITYSLQLSTDQNGLVMLILADVILADGSIMGGQSDYFRASGAKEISYISNAKHVELSCAVK